MRRRSAPEILEELRRRLQNPDEQAGCIEWVRRLATRKDAELLSGVVKALADHIETPPRRRRGRPKQKAPPPRTGDDGSIVVDRMAIPLLPAAQMKARARLQANDHAIYEAVALLQRRFTLVGAIRKHAYDHRLTEAAVREAYYRAKKS